MVEAILFASSEPVSVTELESRMPQGSNPGSVLDELKIEYSHRGVNLVKVGAGWAMRTSPDLSFLMRKETVETRKLSRAAVETLAIIAYHQPYNNRPTTWPCSSTNGASWHLTSNTPRAPDPPAEW